MIMPPSDGSGGSGRVGVVDTDSDGGGSRNEGCLSIRGMIFQEKESPGKTVYPFNS